MLIFVNSNTDRQPTDSTNKFSVYFNNPIELPNQSKIGLKSIQLPYTCTQFKESNSILWVARRPQFSQNIEIATAIHIDYTKFYDTINDVVTELNAQTTLLSLPLTFSIINNKIALKNNSEHTKFRVVSSQIFEPTFKGSVFSNGIDYNPHDKAFPLFNQANEKLGFIGDLRNTSIPIGTTYISAGLPRIIRTNCFYLETNIIDYENTLGNPYKQPNIMAKVPTLNNFGSLICMNWEDPNYYKISDNSIDFISFNVLDEDLEEVDLNGAPVTLTLEIH